MKTAREEILNRIEEIRIKTNNFNSTSMRWRNFSNGTEKRHISELEFDKMNDFELVFLFERIIRRYNKQM